MRANRYSFVASLIFFAYAMSASATITFQKVYSASGPANTSAGMLQTFDGNYCVAGGVGDNSGDFSLVKLDLNGDTLWTHLYGGNLREDFSSAVQTRDSGFILCGSTYSFSNGNDDAYVVKTDMMGNLLWSKNYGGFNSERFSTIRQTVDGGFIAVGTTTSYGSGGLDILLVKLNSTGDVIWAKTIGGQETDYGLSLQQTNDNGYIISGYTTSFLATSGRIYLVKTDSLGSVTWSSIFGGVAGESGKSVRQCRDSGYIVTGYTQSFGTGTMDVYLLKVTKSGGLSWMKTYGGSGFDNGYDVEQTADNGFIAVGCTQSFGPDSAGLSENVYLIKTDPFGNTQWARAYKGIIDNYGYAVKQTADTGYIIADCRFGFRLTKTDSLGMISCAGNGTGTVTTAVSPTVSSGAFSTSPGIVGTNAATLTRHTAMIKSTNCDVAPTGVNTASSGTSITQVYPNPFSNTLSVETVGQGVCELVIFNLMSQRLIQERFERRKMVSTENLSPGIYYYELRNSGQLLKSGKLLKH